ncbi:hypothetical protein MRB53_039542 [Persea americana]|nr:hypothetical protein MRB53_039542 [Persea americana]
MTSRVVEDYISITPRLSSAALPDLLCLDSNAVEDVDEAGNGGYEVRVDLPSWASDHLEQLNVNAEVNIIHGGWNDRLSRDCLDPSHIVDVNKN